MFQFRVAAMISASLFFRLLVGSVDLGLIEQDGLVDTRIELHEGQLWGSPWTTGRVEEASAGSGQQLDNDGPCFSFLGHVSLLLVPGIDLVMVEK